MLNAWYSNYIEPTGIKATRSISVCVLPTKAPRPCSNDGIASLQLASAMVLLWLMLFLCLAVQALISLAVDRAGAVGCDPGPRSLTRSLATFLRVVCRWRWRWRGHWSSSFCLATTLSSTTATSTTSAVTTE